MKLRDYQEQLIRDVKKKFAKGKKRVVMQAPTGSGKTVTFVELAKRTLEKNPESAVLIFTNRLELQQQAKNTLEKANIPVYTIEAGKKNVTELMPGATVAMVETFNRRKINIDKLKLTIIDECHIGNFRKITEKLQDHYIIGATATPLSASKDLPLKLQYNDIVCSINIPELIEQGYLANPEYFHLVPKKIGKLKEERGEFTDESQQEVFEDVELFSDLMREFSKFSTKKTIIFCNNISTTKLVYEQFKANNYKVDYVVSGGENDRKEVFDKFRNNEIQILVNCGIATTGYDEPSIECVILYRATKSFPLYLQMVGRGSRVTDKKKDFIILDFGQNVKRHGYWDNPVNWESVFNNPPKKGEAVAPVKECSSCGALLRINEMICPICGEDQEKEAKEKKYLEAQLEKIQRAKKEALNGKRPSQMTVDELIMVQEIKGHKSGWVARVLRSREDSIYYLKEYQRKKKFKPKWANFNQFGPTEFKDNPIKF
jgi:superfamily II DNA or RNA helicase